METSRLHSEAGKKHVDPPWPRIDPGPAPASRTRGFFFLALRWLFPGGVGCFFDGRPVWGGLTFGKWIANLTDYCDGRVSAGAPPFVAPNMADRRRSAERISWFLKSNVDGPPANAAEIQGKLHACDHSFMERDRRFGGGFLNGE